MKKKYMVPRTKIVSTQGKICILESSGQLGDSDYESKQSDTIWDDVDDDEGDVTGVSKPKDLWSEDGEVTDE